MPSSGYDSTRVVQISNVSPSASREQLYHMFGYFGRIDEMKFFPSETSPLFASATSKLCFIKYDEYDSVDAAQHMTNTVFIDRALVCVPVMENKIPEEETAMKVGAPALGGQRQLPPNLMNQIQVVGSQQLMVTIDPSLAALGLPPYPPLPANTDAVKMEEIRRTVYVGNIPRDVKPKEIVDFFNERIGEVNYLRMAGDDHCYAYVEFTNQHSVPTALQNNSIEFMRAKLRIQHSTVAIIKPLVKTIDMAKKEVEDALKNAEATNPTLGKGMDVDEVLRRFTSSPLIAKSPRSPSNRIRSRSRSRGRSSRIRSRSRSKSRHESVRMASHSLKYFLEKQQKAAEQGNQTGHNISSQPCAPPIVDVEEAHSSLNDDPESEIIDDDEPVQKKLSRRRSRSRSETRSSRRRYRSRSPSRDRSRSRNKRPMRSPSRSKSRGREDRYASSSRRRSHSKSKENKRGKVEERSSRKERDDRDRDSRREKDRKVEKVHETKDREGKSSSRRTVDDDKVRRRREKRSRSRSRGKEVSKSERDNGKSSKRKNAGRGSPAVLKSNEEPSENKPKIQKMDEKQFKSTKENDAVYGPISSEDIKNKRIVSDSEPVQESLEDLFTAAENFVSHIKTEDEENIKQENIVESTIELEAPDKQIVPTKIESSSNFKDGEVAAPSKESIAVVIDRKSSSKAKKEKSKKRDKKKKKSSKSSKKRRRAESSSSSSPSVSSDTDEGSPEA